MLKFNQRIYEIKNAPLVIKDIDSIKGIVSGYFSAFGNVDSDRDIINKGAYAKTILEKGPKSNKPRIKHMLDHDTTKGIGKLLELEEDSTGLAYVSQLGRHTLGRDALLMYEDGLITEHSVGFKTVRDQQAGENIREILEINLYEGSALQGWGANEFTPVTGIKSIAEYKPSDLFKRLDILLKALKDGKYSDETFLNIEIEYAQVKQAVLDLNDPTLAPGADSAHPNAGNNQEQNQQAPPVDFKTLLDTFKNSAL